MASLTKILGTDSLSSSRIVINDNFESINDQVSNIADLLDTDSQSLTLTGNIGASGLSLTNNGTSSFIVNSSDITASLPVTLNGSLILAGGMRDSIAEVSVMPSEQTYLKTTYILNADDLSGVNIISNGSAGQTVTFIASGASGATIDATNIAGVATNFVIYDNGTLTVRYANGYWYVISHANTTLTF
jgi:hypothetical protein